MPRIPLLVSRKQAAARDNPEIATAFRQVEEWANHVVVPGTPYASLTGLGETNTPGALTQLGEFTVDDGSAGINLEGLVNITDSPTGFAGHINANVSGGITLETQNTISIFNNGSTGGISIICQTSSSAYSLSIDNVNGAIGIGHSGGHIGVAGAVAVACPVTVTGSRGGNAALASLLTALASIGWITNSTTP